jgi:hypothetical protein
MDQKKSERNDAKEDDDQGDPSFDDEAEHQEFRSRQANPECEEKHVIGKKTSLGNTIQGPSGKRTPPGKGWPPAGSEHCVVGSDVGTKRMERVLKPCD